MKKAAMIVPLMEDEFKKREYGNKEFLGPQYLVSILRSNGIDCDYINAHAYRINNKNLCNKILEENYDFVGISCTSQRGYLFTYSLIEMLRSNGFKKHICLGGFFTTIAFEDILNNRSGIDSILLGEGEFAICDLVRNVIDGDNYTDIKGVAYLDDNGNVVWSNPERITDLDSIPYPIRDIDAFGDVSVLGTNKIISKFFRVIAGRGCYGSCAFCTLISFYQPRYKIYRSVENLIGELEMLVNTYGINDFRFNDEIFYELSEEGQKWVEDFVKAVKAKNLQIRFNIELRANDVREKEIRALKSVGLERVAIGAESGVQRLLDEMNKNCTVLQVIEAINVLRDNDMDTAIGFITIIPTMSFEELKSNYQFLFDTKLDSEENLYNKLNLYCGCEYINIMKKKNLFIESGKFYERHNYLYSDQRVECFASVIESIRKKFSDNKKKINSINNNQSEFIRYNQLIWKKIVVFMLDYISQYHYEINAMDLENKALQYVQDDVDLLHRRILEVI